MEELDEPEMTRVTALIYSTVGLDIGARLFDVRGLLN